MRADPLDRDRAAPAGDRNGREPALSRRALLCGAVAAGLFGLEAADTPAARANALKIGAQAPPATLVTLDGERISTTALRGQVVVLTFWATWCSPCRAELPLLGEYAAHHAQQGLQVLGFSLDEAEALAQVRAIASTLPFPNGLLTRGNVAGYGRIWRVPVNFTIARDGRLAANGWQDKDPTWTAARLDRLVTPLLAEPAPTP